MAVIKKAVLMSDPDPQFVSIVDKGANKKRWAVVKRAQPVEDEPDLSTVDAESAAERMGFWSGIRALVGGRGATGIVSAAEKAEGRILQALVFDATAFSVDTARAWAKKRGLKAGEIEEADGTFRLRQCAPEACVTDTFDTRPVEDGVVAVIAQKVLTPAPKVDDKPADDKKSPPSIAEKAGPTDFNVAVSMLEVQQALPDIWDLFYAAQCCVSNVMQSDEIVDKAEGIKGVMTAFTERLMTQLDDLPSTAAKQLAVAAKRARRITLIEDVDLRTAERVLAQLLHEEEPMTDVEKKAAAEKAAKDKAEKDAAAAAAAKPAEPADKSVIPDQTVAINDMLIAFNGVKDSLTGLIDKLKGMEQSGPAAAAKSAEQVAAEKAATDKAAAEKAAADAAAAAKPAEPTATEKSLSEGIGRIEAAVKGLNSRIDRVETTVFGRRSAPEAASADGKQKKGAWDEVLFKH